MKTGNETIYQSPDTLTKSAPCQFVCPIHTKVPTYVSLIDRRRFQEAWEIIKLDNPLPSACARVCHHPCQTQCQAGKWGGAVSIRVLKRVATDYAMNHGLMKPVGPRRVPDGKSVGIIGAGPSGLAAANDLAEQGYRVTIYERLETPGGAMAACIPEYRMPNDILNLDIENILHKGVELKLNTEVGRDVSFEEMRRRHPAVYVATGCHRSKKLRVADEDAQGVLYSMEFLNDKNLQRNKIRIGRRVGVIGGGNAAMDAARVAQRQPECEEVTLIYRRTRREMPAYEEEIEAALDEGVTLLPLTNPARIVTRDGKMIGVECIKMELGAPDESGRRRPVPVEGSEFVIDLDTLIIAIGEDADTSYLGKGSGIEITKWDTIVADENLGKTSLEGVFSGGDVVTGPKTVIEAIAAGKRAAVSIDQYLRGEPLERPVHLPDTAMYMRPHAKLCWR